MPDTSWIKARLGDEFGLVDEDLLKLYGLAPAELDDYLVTLGNSPAAVANRLISDLDAVRVGYRTIQISDEQMNAVLALLAAYPFHPMIALDTASHQKAWRLSGDDAQWVAFRVADLLGIDFEASDTLRRRLNRVAVWPRENAPAIDDEFLRRVADVTFYLAELSGVL